MDLLIRENLSLSWLAYIDLINGVSSRRVSFVLAAGASTLLHNVRKRITKIRTAQICLSPFICYYVFLAKIEYYDIDFFGNNIGCFHQSSFLRTDELKKMPSAGVMYLKKKTTNHLFFYSLK